MDFMGVALAHSIGRREGKSPFFFSRFNFQRMKERGNTHYCFHCGGQAGFRPGADGRPTNHVEESGYDSMKSHGPDHADGVIGGGFFQRVSRYTYAGDWINAHLRGRKNFPYIVAIT